MSTYHATVHWQRNGQDFIDDKYSRAHEWAFDGGLVVPASPSPHVVPPPLSDEANIDPEEAFVASLSSCHMLFFLAFAAKKKLRVDDYTDAAYGVLAKNALGQMAMTEVVLKPRVQFAEPVAQDVVDELHHRAHSYCFIANSVKSEVRIEPVWPD